MTLLEILVAANVALMLICMVGVWLLAWIFWKHESSINSFKNRFDILIPEMTRALEKKHEQE